MLINLCVLISTCCAYWNKVKGVHDSILRRDICRDKRFLVLLLREGLRWMETEGEQEKEVGCKIQSIVIR